MQGTQHLKPLRTRVYIDGYNLYYGCLRRSPFKWLDIWALFAKRILPSILVTDDEGNSRQSYLITSPSIKYFTAKIVESVAQSSESVSSQARYHTALRKSYDSNIQIIEGYFAVNKVKVKIVDLDIPDRAPRACQNVIAWKIEEKQSDVNLSLQAYHDAITGAVDQVVIVTNDN